MPRLGSGTYIAPKDHSKELLLLLARSVWVITNVFNPSLEGTKFV